MLPEVTFSPSLPIPYDSRLLSLHPQRVIPTLLGSVFCVSEIGLPMTITLRALLAVSEQLGYTAHMIHLPNQVYRWVTVILGDVCVAQVRPWLRNTCAIQCDPYCFILYHRLRLCSPGIIHV